MNHSSKIGFSFGATSGIVTTLGLIVGLSASDASRTAIIGGVLTIAFTDALSDAFGIHISEESENTLSNRDVWIATVSTFVTKIIFALTFLVPIIFLSSTLALIACIVWGILILTLINYIIVPAHKRWRVISQHLFIGMIVIIVGFIIGQYIRSVFN